MTEHSSILCNLHSPRCFFPWMKDIVKWRTTFWWHEEHYNSSSNSNSTKTILKLLTRVNQLLTSVYVCLYKEITLEGIVVKFSNTHNIYKTFIAVSLQHLPDFIVVDHQVAHMNLHLIIVELNPKHIVNKI